MIITMIIIITMITVTLYACCKVSGDCSREEERRDA
jgi:hypothetical protein